MGIYYHITKRSFLPSIMEQGLVPKYGELSDAIMEERRAVYLFKELSEVAYALDDWYGKMMGCYNNREGLALLRVEVPDDFHLTERYDWEMISYTVIPAQYLHEIPLPQSEKNQNAKK